MTGLECLKDELIKHGYTKQQAESKVVAGVLDIVCKAGNKYTVQEALLKDREQLLGENLQLNRMIDYKKEEIARIDKELSQRIKDAQNYIDSWYKAISECETAEGRDKMRIAQMYVNSVTVESAYDRTAFIVGLAAIISGEKIAPIEELKKINKKLFEERDLRRFGITWRDET